MPLDPSLGLKALAALGAVVLLAAVALRALRAATGAAKPGAGRRRLIIQEVLPLDPKRRLVLVRCDDRDLLLVTGGATDVPLGWLPPTGDGA